MKQKTGRKLLSFLLTMAMVVGLMPGMGLTAYAADVPYASLKNTTNVINFDGKKWYLIDCDDSTVTLLAKECVGVSRYDTMNPLNVANTWYTNNITATAKTAVNGSGMFLLTIEQVKGILGSEDKEATSEVLKCSKPDGADYPTWWLGSPGLTDSSGMAIVLGSSGKLRSDGASKDNVFGVRPALKLDLSKVTFDANTNTFSTESTQTHSFTYEASGNTITATCSDAECTLENKKASLTIAAPASLAYDGSAKAAVITDANHIQGTAKVQYHTKNGDSYGTATETAPTNPGTYKASITLGEGNGAATASVEYTITATPLTITGATLTSRDYIEGNKSVTVSAVAFDGGTPTIGTDYTATAEMEDDTAGNGKAVTVTVTLINQNYSLETNTFNTTVNISKAKPAKPAVPTAESITDTSVMLTATEGYQYKRENGGGWQDSNAFTGLTENTQYLFYQRVKGDDNHSDSDSSDALVIKTKQEPISYAEYSKNGNFIEITIKTITEYIKAQTTSNTVWLKDGDFYVVKGEVTLNNGLVYSGNVTIILCDNSKLTIKGGIWHYGSELTIYGQDGQSGEIVVEGDKNITLDNAPSGIDASKISKDSALNGGSIHINGGKLSVTPGAGQNMCGTGATIDFLSNVSFTGAKEGGTQETLTEGSYGATKLNEFTGFEAKPVATVTTAPTAKTGLTANGSAQALVNAGTANGGTMQYALGTSSAATGAYSTTIPTATAAGTYYVWYKAVGSDGESAAACVTVTISAPPAPTTYSVTVNNGTGGGSYTAGATVTITADAAPEGKVFDKWTGSVSFADAASASTTFTMPASAVTVTATYKDKPSIADMTVYDIPDQSSTGEQITPKPVVKYLGHLLTEGTDYELSYGKNTELGEGTVTITGKGNYTGSLTKTFKIVLAAYGGTLTVAAPGAYTYGDALGAAPAVTSSAGSLSGETVKVYYSATPSGEGTAWSSGEVLNAGTYYVWAELAKTAAHDAATSVRVTFTVSKATPAAPAGVLAASYADTYKVTLSIPGDKTYADYEYSLDGTNWTSVPALKDGAFTPAGLSAGTAYTLSLRTKADSNHNASPAATATLKTPAKVLLSYDANGSTASVPASVEYDSGATVTAAAAITRAGYTFAGWNTAANGGGTAYAAGAAFTISANTTLYAQWTPITYSVDYHENGGNACTDETGKAYNAEITFPTPTYAEHTFNGWATVSGGSPVYRGGQKVSGLTSVNGATVDLYAVWTENTYKITGEVKEERDGTTEQSIVAGVTVKIMRGSVEFATTATDDYGKYTFSGVPAGSYNIVATRTVDGKNQTMTALVEVKSDKTVETIVLPPSGINSALDVKGDSTPPVMVGGLDDVAKDEAEENKEVTVTMTVEQKDENTATEQQKQEMKEIKEAVAADSTTDEGSTELEFLDVKVEKKTEDGSTTTTEPITETSQVVEMIVPFNTSGRFGFIVYRWHDGKAEAFQKRSSPFAAGSFMDGWYYVDMVAGLFHIYGSRFSTYAIGYEEGTGYTLTVNNGTGSGEFAVGATITITADAAPSGKVFDRWTTGDGVDFADATASTTTFVMPAKNVTVTATYKTASSPAPYYPGGGGYTPTYAIQVEKAEHGTVKTSYEKTTSGTKVTITATPDAGYEVGSVTVTDASGNSVKVTKNTNGTYSFIMPASSVTVRVTFVLAAASGDVCDPFRDIDRSAWYHTGVHYVLEKGIMSGMGDGQFAPSGTTTRAQLAQILWNMEGKPAAAGALNFTDVNPSEWYAAAIRWANAEGIIGGYGNNLFGPNDALTREQLVTILYRYAKYKGIDVSVGEDTNILSYDDAFDISEWAIPAMQWAVGSGLISGKTASTLNPQDKATRAEIATIIMRYCEEIAK